MLDDSLEFRGFCWRLARRLHKHKETYWEIIARASGECTIHMSTSEAKAMAPKYLRLEVDDYFKVLLENWTEPRAFSEAMYGFVAYQTNQVIKAYYLKANNLKPCGIERIAQIYPYERSKEIWEDTHKAVEAYMREEEPWIFWPSKVDPTKVDPTKAPTFWDHLLET